MDPATARLTALLGSLTNYERRRPDRPRWSLDNMRALLARPGRVHPAGQAVQVGGSKGKGTTTLYLESLAGHAGLTTGAYMSPHLQTLLERVRVQGRNIPEDVLHSALSGVLAFAGESGIEPTFFEVMTAAALDCFAGSSLDLWVLEVGLGGRLDSTTAVPVDASIVTGIELEHTAMLGETVEAIAGEKAWVIRPDRPAFTAASGPALGVLEARAAEVGADLWVLGRDLALLDVEHRHDRFAGVLCDAAGDHHRFVLPGASAFELPAFALAAACLRRLRPDLPLPLDPVPRPVLPGRFEVFTAADGVPVVLDGAHTQNSAETLARELEHRFPGRRLAVLFAVRRDKRWRESLKCLLPLADSFVVTALSETPMVDPGEIVSWLQAAGVAAESADDCAAGLELLAARQPGVRVVTGSFYLVGEARSRLHILGIPDLS